MKAEGVNSILVFGATGFVGKPLTERLISRGYSVTCLVRNLKRAKELLPGEVNLIEGNVLNYEDVLNASENIDIIYYLVHSIPYGEKKFEKLDIQAARNVASAAAGNKVNRIIYLGGLGKKDSNSSAHLKSRHEVGEILRTGGCRVTEFRAAVIAGKGGLSFEMIHHLVNRLPVMICPMWVYTRTQPIALPDVVRYLGKCLEIRESEDKIIDIGGPDILSYGEMMTAMSEALGLKRYLIRVPVLTPRLSSYWVDLVTPVQASYARTLIEGLRYETVCENDLANRLFNFRPTGFRDTVKEYPGSLNPHNGTAPTIDNIDESHIFVSRVEKDVKCPAPGLFNTVRGIGGDHGWFYANWLWKLRGFIDSLMGGIGYRKGRDNETEMNIGDKIDFWRVEEYRLNMLIRLRAEMKVWGYGWLEFETVSLNGSNSRLSICAYYYPRGMFGYIYWFFTRPIHKIVFSGMAKKIARQAEKL
ncbi:MAG: SDR family oxidoreductase [Candidatus Zixiibacteriota bacterium]|nr:MAG: SDR family oxidoreductase [candidate division Zixibacteria bacterium]